MQTDEIQWSLKLKYWKKKSLPKYVQPVQPENKTGCHLSAVVRLLSKAVYVIIGRKREIKGIISME